MNLTTIETILVDGDGVLWRSNKAIPGLQRFFDVLKKCEINWALLTNNNTRTVNDYVKKLRGFGVDVEESRIFTSSTATADYLKQRYGPGASIHAVGMRGLIETLEGAGFVVSCGEGMPPRKVVAVAAGMDRAITYDKIKIAMRLILDGAEFVATNTDATFPTPDGLNPGTGMIIRALQTVTGVEPVVIGKPERMIYEAAMKRLGADLATTAMLGDRLETDILGAQRSGLGTIVVLTGITTREQLAVSDVQPDLVYESIAELTDALSTA